MHEVRVNISQEWIPFFLWRAIGWGGILFMCDQNFDGGFCLGWKFPSKEEGQIFYDWSSDIFCIADEHNFCHWWMVQDVRWKKPGHESSKYVW